MNAAEGPEIIIDPSTTALVPQLNLFGAEMG
jgi:hypothetical protein